MSDEDDHSEDGQLRSPHYTTNTNDRDSSNEDDTPDSLEIKPPQSIGRYDKMKKSWDHKHSREHRHGERGGENAMRERNARSGGGSRRDDGLDARYHSDGRSRGSREQREPRDERHDPRGYPPSGRYEKGIGGGNRGDSRMLDPYHHHTSSGGGKNAYGSDREKSSSRSKGASYERKRESPSKTDAEREMDDLRSKLLSKRSRQDIERKLDEHQHYQEYSRATEKGGRKDERSERRSDKDPHHGKHRTKQRHLVEMIDSPENYGDVDGLSEKKRQEDPELIARRAKLLDADREMVRRKELAREELKQRREQHRERGEFDEQEESLEESASPSPPAKRRHHKRRHHGANDVEIVQISDNSDGDHSDGKRQNKLDKGEDVEEGDDDDTASDSNSEYSEHDDNSEDDDDGDDDELPGSPISIDALSKSDHRRRHSRSQSRSQQRSLSPRNHSTSRSRSVSRSPVPQLGSSRPSTPTSDMEKNDEAIDRPANTENSTNVSDQNATAGATTIVDNEDDNSPDAHLPNYLPGLQGCRSVEEFKCLNRIAEGTYGIVYRAQDKRTEEIVALKRLKMEKEKEGFPITSLREINTLLKGQHPNIVTVREIVVGSNMDKIFIVMDYVEHDFKTLMETMQHRKQFFLPGEVKCLSQQLLRAVAHLHDNWILHRDLKTSNLLLSHKGILKVGDFGLAREYGSPLKAYTSVVVTLWYRAPELLLCCKEYSTPIDMWSVGCIFAEFLTMQALFPGQSETDELNKIFKFLGTPNENIWPGYNQLPAVQKMKFTEFPKSNLREKFGHRTSEQGLQLLQGLLTYDPKQRFTADKALRSEYFKELPLPIDPAMLPTWPAKSELGARKALASSPKPPSGGGQYKKLGDNDNENHGFILGASMDARQMAMGAGFSLKF